MLGGRDSSTESLELVPLLCSAGADPNAQTRFGEPLILIAIDANNAASVYAPSGSRGCPRSSR